MQISSYSSYGNVGGYGQGRGRGGAQSLTDSQQSALTDILSQYDPSNLTSDDKASIRQQIQDAGIQPGRALGQALTEAGFDPQSLRPEGAGQGQRPQGKPPGVGGPPPQNGQSGVSLTSDQTDQLKSILEQLTNNDSTDDSTALTSLQSFLEELGKNTQQNGRGQNPLSGLLYNVTA